MPKIFRTCRILTDRGHPCGAFKPRGPLSGMPRELGSARPSQSRRCPIERRAARSVWYVSRGGMISFARTARAGAASLLLIATALPFSPALADDGFPFGTEMQLDVSRQPGSKRIPNLEIGDAGEVVLELWCKGGKGQFSVAGNTVIFVAGAMENRPCPPDRAQADDELIAALTEAGTWKRQGDLVSFVGAKTLRFRINTN
jgi:hypothetical protein